MLPEVVGDRKLVLPIPPRFTPAIRAIPTPEETEEWLEAIVALWDAPDDAERLGAKLQDHVQRYANNAVTKELETVLDELAR